METAIATNGRTGPFRVGVGGPVGSGKTALIEALVPLAIAHGHRPLVITNDIFTTLDAAHVRATLAGVLDPERVIGVETGSCPHTAVRDDPTMNLAAMAELVARFPDADLLVINEIDLAPYVRADLAVMRQGATEARAGGGPFVLTDCLTGEGLPEVLAFLEGAGGLGTRSFGEPAGRWH